MLFSTRLVSPAHTGSRMTSGPCLESNDRISSAFRIRGKDTSSTFGSHYTPSERGPGATRHHRVVPDNPSHFRVPQEFNLD